MCADVGVEQAFFTPVVYAHVVRRVAATRRTEDGVKTGGGSHDKKIVVVMSVEELED